MKKHYNKLRFNCKNASIGCKTVLSPETVEAHEEKCLFEKCSSCGSLPITNINLQERVTALEDRVKQLEMENQELYSLIYLNPSKTDDEIEQEKEWNDMREESRIQDLEQQLIA